MLTKRQLRKKIKSAKSIAKITRAMQMVAASKMKRAQLQAQASRTYVEGIGEFCSLLWSQADPSLHPLLIHKPDSIKDEIVILVAPDKGLCGSLVTNLARFFVQMFPATTTIQFVTIGKKAKIIANRTEGTILADFVLGLSQPKYEIVPPIARLVAEKFLSPQIARVTAVYSGFISTMVQKPVFKPLLPLNLFRASEYLAFPKTGMNEARIAAFPPKAEPFSKEKPRPSMGGEASFTSQPQEKTKFSPYLFEPTTEAITHTLLQMYLEVEIYQFLLESYASEQSARMVAMKNATDNAQSLVSQLTLGYNNARQAGITAELIDIGTAMTAIQ